MSNRELTTEERNVAYARARLRGGCFDDAYAQELDKILSGSQISRLDQLNAIVDGMPSHERSVFYCAMLGSLSVTSTDESWDLAIKLSKQNSKPPVAKASDLPCCNANADNDRTHDSWCSGGVR